ncbi:YqhG family protein [Bacillus solimangrovi]|uniref:YqhG n=1 Tax=Bacillus solimangrovi TaxID=1305675 RepID=A0A1E5LFL2_9BACI|nr:YqhG family protein [Bacillus solimangrovi]OEH92878.1 hypothetical protein BFG57_14470 [Bacillus solimangrovi]
MQQVEIHHFLKRYFTSTNCNILNQTPGMLQVQLTIEMDKLLMNRPFYWHYLEKTGGTPNPMQLTLITDQTNSNEYKGEVIHFGSPRLHQIFRSVQTLGGHIRLFEDFIPTNGTAPLQPWLGINVKISYEANQKKDEIISLGLNLIHGAVFTNFQELLSSLPLTPVIPDYCFTLSPLITVNSGLKRVERFIENHINRQDHSWATDATNIMNEHLSLLDAFYEDVEEKPESYYSEQAGIKEMYEPIIRVNIVNGGLFYLSQQTLVN